jgi:hypothetical protein
MLKVLTLLLQDFDSGILSGVTVLHTRRSGIGTSLVIRSPQPVDENLAPTGPRYAQVALYEAWFFLMAFLYWLSMSMFLFALSMNLILPSRT